MSAAQSLLAMRSLADRPQVCVAVGVEHRDIAVDDRVDTAVAQHELDVWPALVPDLERRLDHPPQRGLTVGAPEYVRERVVQPGRALDVVEDRHEQTAASAPSR